MMIGRYRIHPLCDALPAMPEPEFERLKESIRRNGLRHPIWFWRDQIVDGSNRLRACLELEIEPRFKEWAPKVPDNWQNELKEFIVIQNVLRRHLSASQRAFAAAQLVTTDGAGRPKIGETSTISQGEAANALGVDRKSVNRAAAVLEGGSAALKRAVRDGEISVEDAANIADLPADEQKKALKAVERGEARTVTAAARSRDRTGDGLSIRTAPYIVLAEIPILAETPQLAVDMLAHRNPGMVARAVAKRGDPLRDIIGRCSVGDCPTVIFKGDKFVRRGDKLECGDCRPNARLGL